MKNIFLTENHVYVFHCLHNKRGIALIGAKNVRTGVITNGTMFSLLMSQGLTSYSKHVYIWRESGTWTFPFSIIEHDRIDSAGVMVWGGIMIYVRMPLHIFNSGPVTNQSYQNEDLESYVRFFKGAYGFDFLFILSAHALG